MLRFLPPIYCIPFALFVITLPAEAKSPNAPKVGGLSLSGLSPAAARQRLTRGLSKKLDFRVVLTDGRRFVWRRRRDLGVYLALDEMLKSAKSGKNIPVRFDIRTDELQKALRQLAPRFASAGAAARIGETKGKVRVVPHRNVRYLDAPASAQSIAQQWKRNPGAKRLTVKMIEKPPIMTAQRLKGINARLASFTTRFNPGKVKRTINLRLGIKEINGTLLSPNEVFSLNGVVGERTQARGYRSAIIFKNGYQVPGIGAGLSQVTGTLFNAALMAGLPIVTYRTHSRPVAYLPLGRDATVAWGSFDMKFKNNTGAPIYIAYKAGANSATATLYGAKQAKPDKVSLKVAVQRIGPREIKAQLYRWIRRDGKIVKQKVGASHYKWNVGAWED